MPLNSSREKFRVMNPAPAPKLENPSRPQKRILIVYASAGAGHQKAAQALHEYLKTHNPENAALKTIDILDYMSVPVKFLYSKGYIFLISRFPFLWYLIYRISFYFASAGFRAFLDYMSAKKFVRLLKEERPQVLVSTHFLASSIISVFKEKFPGSGMKFISIITDYNLHPLWIGNGVDIYIASCAYVRDELLKRGVCIDRIKPYGIPAGEVFYQAKEREVISKKLKLNPSKFTALVITGAIGIGPIEKIIDSLADKIQLLVVCARNKRLYKRVQEKKLNQVKVFGFIDYVDELMAASDIVLTKAGGLTITESLAKGLAMVFFSNIPGLETANARVIEKNGCGYDSFSIKGLIKKVFAIKDNKEYHNSLYNNIARFRKTKTLQDIASQINIYLSA